jgi:PKD repeat protein
MRMPCRHVRVVAALAMAVAILSTGCDESGSGGGFLPILGPPPTADVVADLTLVKAGVAVAFSLDVEGLAPATYAWDFGDGEGLEGAGLAGTSHAFAAEGTYVVTATATDSSGNAVTATITVDVTPAGGAPVLTVESVEIRGTVTDATACIVTVNGAATVDAGANDFTWRDDLDASPETYEVRAVDQGENVTTQTVTVTVN